MRASLLCRHAVLFHVCILSARRRYPRTPPARPSAPTRPRAHAPTHPRTHARACARACARMQVMVLGAMAHLSEDLGSRRKVAYYLHRAARAHATCNQWALAHDSLLLTATFCGLDVHKLEPSRSEARMLALPAGVQREALAQRGEQWVLGAVREGRAATAEWGWFSLQASIMGDLLHFAQVCVCVCVCVCTSGMGDLLHFRLQVRARTHTHTHTHTSDARRRRTCSALLRILAGADDIPCTLAPLGISRVPSPLSAT